MGTTEAVRALAVPLLEARGASLYDIEQSGTTLRVVVERPGGIDLDTIGTITRELSTALDESDPIDGRWYLEVSSPGLERALRTPAHFVGAVGTRVKLKLLPGGEVRRLEGTVVGADDESVELDLGGEATRVPLGDIESAKTVFEWGPAPHAGSPSKGAGGAQQQQQKKSMRQRSER